MTYSHLVIDWNLYTREEFTRIVNLLVKAFWADELGVEVRPVDGRGGDDGVDVEVRHPSGKFTIFQIKFFKEGFSSENRNRRNQIKKSWNRVYSRQDVDKWVLVIPIELTPGEYDFLYSLANPNKIKIEFWGSANLDLLLTQHPQIRAYAEKTPAHLKEAALFQTERAELLNPVPDLVERVKNLGLLSETADHNFKYSFGYDQGKVVISAKPQPGAPNPKIQVNLRVANESEKHLEINEVIGFGLDQPLTLSEELVEVTMEGPFTTAPDSNASLSLMPNTSIPHELKGQPVIFSFFDADEHRIGEYSGITEHLGNGPFGFSLRVTFFHCLTVVLFGSPNPDIKAPNPKINFRPVGSGVQDFTDAINFMATFPTARKFQISINGKVQASWHSNDMAVGSVEEFQDLLGLAEDLQKIETLLKMKFVFMEEPSLLDVVLANAVSIILEGNICAVPLYKQISFDTDQFGLNSLQSAQKLDPQNVRIPSHDFTIRLLGMDVRIGTVALWNPHAQFEVRIDDVDFDLFHVTCTTPVDECFIFFPFRESKPETLEIEVYWPVPREDFPDWLKVYLEPNPTS